MKRILFGLGMALLTFGCQQQETSSSSNEPLKIGAIAPMTGDGAVYGDMQQKVLQLKTEQLNQSGGLNGREINIVLEDGKCNPADSSRAAQKLIGIDGVSVILGGFCSGETLGAAPIAERKQVILFTGVSSSPEITHAGDFIFRTSPSDTTQAEVLANYANENFEKIGMLAEQTDYALALAQTFAEKFQGELVEEQYLSTESDFKTRITKLKNENVEALFLDPQTGPKYEIILKQLQEQGWDTPILQNEIATGSTETIAKFKDFLSEKGTVGANFVAPDSPKLKKFMQQYSAKYNEELPYTNYAAGIIDSFDILMQTLQKIDDPTNTKKIRDEFYAMKNFPGIFGDLNFDENGDVNITYSLFKFDGEKFVLLEQ
ncbi:ABC transporter substrate-binding protein [Candidatus Gracilibacteria bacterium]|nr:ABC transporter substrate-binding protein [Candidatus Gracilibacteria bacterium]MCF7819774.1 ABC transporter substrate-binding protein [Candidatus Gracilibacteria bacterium]